MWEEWHIFYSVQILQWYFVLYQVKKKIAENLKFLSYKSYFRVGYIEMSGHQIWKKK